jgi:hypothetical protein
VPTTIQSIINDVRIQLNEPSANLWQDSELLGYANRGIKDLRRHINQTHQNYSFSLSTGAVATAASSSELTGVPTDVGVILNLEPADLQTYPLNFRPAAWESSKFQSARRDDPFEATQGGTVWYCITGVGAPSGVAPTIRIAPQVTAVVPLNLSYQPVPANLALSDNVPLPGDADQALIEWVCAYAIARERGDENPDAKRMAAYNGEVAKILVAVAPRDESEPQVVDAMFEDYWS